MSLRWLLYFALAFGASAQDDFDHSSHDGYFPLCSSCHAGIESGKDPFPPLTMCASCHDDERMPVVEWAGPTVRASRLRFDHRTHVAAAARSGQKLECAQCHDPDADEFQLNVEPLAAETCFACHGESRGHFEQEGRCEVCHVSLADYAGPWDAATMPRPTSHEAADFLSKSGHATQAEHFTSDCSVCHARESCERCHRNASSLAPVRKLPTDDRVAAWLSGQLALYPTPRDHDADWLRHHGAAASANAASCSNCHAQESCSDCHREGSASSIAAQLPALRSGESDPTVKPRLGFHPPEFARRHAGEASLTSASCMNCHAQQSCENCHAGEGNAGFHGPQFVERHGTFLYGGVAECSSCHNTETFCRDCHSTMIVGRDDLTSSFHDRSPLWLLQHGEAARFTLESCASCHAQTDCMRCHSQKGGWGVNPHGPDFPADALADANLGVCAICHWDEPR